MKACLNLIIVLSSVFFAPLRAQPIVDTCENVTLKGYIIKQYKKSDIEGIKLNPSNIPIDLYERTYFVPIGNDIFNEKTIDSINVFNPNEVYFPLSRQTNDLIRRYCNTNKSNLLNLNANLGLSVTFFQLKKNKGSFYIRCIIRNAKLLNHRY